MKKVLKQEKLWMLNFLVICNAVLWFFTGFRIEEDNKQYEYLTEGKGRNRKVLHADVQTVPLMMKSRETFCPKSKTKTSSTFASNWEMYDTFLKKFGDLQSSSSDSSSESVHPEGGVNDSSSVDSYRLAPDEKQYAKLLKNPRFLEAATVIERLLANNCFNEQQKIFRGLTVQDDFREDIEYNYRLNHLWTFANENTTGIGKYKGFLWKASNKFSVILSLSVHASVSHASGIKPI